MITGSYPYRGALIAGAVIRPQHLQLGTEPWGMLWFDAEVWASVDTLRSAEGPIETFPACRLSGAENAPAIAGMLADQARAILLSGIGADADDAELADAMIRAAHTAMDDLLLAMPEFAGWQRVP